VRVVVAGGAGFIGRTMCWKLLERGDAVVCVDNLVTGSREHVKELSERPGFTFVEVDISAGADMAGVAAPIDAVINLASPASPADFGPLSLEILATGSTGVTNLLELARRHHARFLQASTSEVYGDPTVHPQPETYWGNVNPIGLRSVYDEAKRFGEALTMAHHRRYGTEVRIARIFNTYGPGMRLDDGRVVSNFVTQALRGMPLTVYGDGSQTRSLCYVEDEVGGLLALLASGYNGPVNVGNDDERTVKEIAELVIELTGSRSEIAYAPLPADDPAQRRPDLTVARRETGWKPVTSLRDGLQSTIDWFRSRLDASSGS
jgi:nucleoside-diphosphate-sugar epimerase